MKINELDKLKNGLYKVYWKSGGYSLAAKGCDGSGKAWFAFTNWLGFTNDRRKYAATILKTELLQIKGMRNDKA